MRILISDTRWRLSVIISPYKFMQRHFSESCLFSSEKTYLWSRAFEANKKQVSPKSYSLKRRINSVNQILKNKETFSINILTRITDWKIPCVYTHVYRGPGPYNSLRHTYNRKYVSGLSLTRNWREAHMFYLAREVVKIWRCSCWEKGNFITINEFRYGKTWKIWPLPLSLSLYNTFKSSFSNDDWQLFSILITTNVETDTIFFLYFVNISKILII